MLDMITGMAAPGLKPMQDAGKPPTPEAPHAPDKKSADPMMHRTNTVDYIVVLKGEIHAIMEKGETLLRAGDVLVQRGTNHSWSVRGNEPCIIGVVLVNAKPLSFAKKKPAAKKAPAKKPKKKK